MLSRNSNIFELYVAGYCFNMGSVEISDSNWRHIAKNGIPPLTKNANTTQTA
jgi:hypothetical protein